MVSYDQVKQLCDSWQAAGQSIEIEAVATSLDAPVSQVQTWFMLWQNEQQAPDFSSDFIHAFRQQATAFTRSFTAQLQQELLSALQQNSELQLLLQQAADDQVFFTSQLAQQQTEITALDQALQQATIEKAQSEAEARRHQQHIDQLMLQLSQLESSQETVQHERDLAVTEMADYQQTIMLIRQQLAEQQQQILADQQQIATQVQQHQSLTQQLEDRELQAANENHALQQQLQNVMQQLAAAEAHEAQQQQHDELPALKAELQQALNTRQQQQAQLQQQQLELAAQAQLIAALQTDMPDHEAQLRQLQETNILLKQQNANAAEHHATQRETIKQLREHLAQLREAAQLAQLSQQQLSEQNQQLLEQVSFVKSNSASTIERLTRNWEQAQAKIQNMEQGSLV